MNTALQQPTALSFNETKTYIMAAIFVAGNIVMPQLAHLVPGGGTIWLPIYFFTLIGAYRYGWRVGVLTALASPIVNSVLFGMPAVSVLPAILTKSVLLAVIAGAVAAKARRATISLLTAVVLGYQILGTLGEWGMTSSLYTALQDFRTGIPGMLLQVFGGWLILRNKR